MNIIDLNKQFYYHFHNRIYLSDPIYEFAQFDRPILVTKIWFGGFRAIGYKLKFVKDCVSKKTYES